MSVTIANQNLA